MSTSPLDVKSVHFDLHPVSVATAPAIQFSEFHEEGLDMAEHEKGIGEGRLVKTLPAGALTVLSLLLRPNCAGSDWKALAGLMGFSIEDIRYFDAEKDDPVLKILTRWSLLHHERATIDKLVDFLRQLKRLDVIEDIQCYLDQALTPEEYRVKQKELQSVADREVIDSSPSTLHENYDVFISYAEADIEFAKELLGKLEDQFHITVCIDYRDFLPGPNRLDQIVEVIERRCRRVIVVYSQDYFNCNNCDFQAKSAMSLSPNCKKRILIPVLYKQCNIPPMFRSIFFLDYTDEDCRRNFYAKLSTAIKRH